MTSVKVKFRPSDIDGEQGLIYYQLIHKRVVRQITSGLRVFSREWNENTESPDILSTDGRADYLLSVKARLDWDVKRLNAVIAMFEKGGGEYSADDIVSFFKERSGDYSFFNFTKSVVVSLRKSGKVRTSEAYAALKSFMVFRDNKDLVWGEVTSELMQKYEAFLRSKGVVKNSSSFYMRILRAIYNRAVDLGLVEQANPFRRVYTGVDKTVKRAIPLLAVRQIKNLDLSGNTRLEFARDMFLFSFYTRGMSFVDMAYLKKKDLQKDVLIYVRRKTGQRLIIKWEQCMQDIVDKYAAFCRYNYMLPVLQSPCSDMVYYRNVLRCVNRDLKKLSGMVGLSLPLTMYVARHSWASIARSRNIPLAVISEGLGHDSETTTQIYLSSIDVGVVDKANSLILRLL